LGEKWPGGRKEEFLDLNEEESGECPRLGMESPQKRSNKKSKKRVEKRENWKR